MRIFYLLCLSRFPRLSLPFRYLFFPRLTGWLRMVHFPFRGCLRSLCVSLSQANDLKTVGNSISRQPNRRSLQTGSKHTKRTSVRIHPSRGLLHPFGNGVLCSLGSAAVFEAAVLVCQDFPIGHSAWQRIMASLHSALRISRCKSVASGGMRAGKQPGASRPPWSKHSGLALITNARRRLRSRV